MLNRNNLLVANICDPSNLRMEISGVHITPEYTEATDQFCLVRVATINTPASELPVVNGANVELKEVILGAEGIKNLKYFKPNKELPILDNVIVSNEKEDRVDLTTTNLEINNTVTVRKIEGNYPNTSQVIGDIKNPRTVTIKLLKKVIDTISKMGIDNADIEIVGEQIIFKGITKEDQDVKAVLMLHLR